MGYTFQLVGCSNLDFKQDVPRETRTILYNKHGSEGSDDTGYANTNNRYAATLDPAYSVYPSCKLAGASRIRCGCRSMTTISPLPV